MRNIQVIPYRPQWVTLFEQEAEKIRKALRGLPADIYHIGSTAVPGLAAKPVIDILITLQNVADIDLCNSEFEALSYECKGEFGIPERRFFMKGGNNRSHHIHAFTHTSPEVTRHLALRDYLIAHPAIAAEYGSLKMSVAHTCNNDIERYCDGKNDFIKYHEQQAIQWAGREY